MLQQIPIGLLLFSIGGWGWVIWGFAARGHQAAAAVEFVDGPNGVTVRVTFDAESTHSIEQQREGWQAILKNFARHVEARG